jgi:hypothetical protein
VAKTAIERRVAALEESTGGSECPKCGRDLSGEAETVIKVGGKGS